jgi:membrane-bound lytic murein transglycosylase B
MKKIKNVLLSAVLATSMMFGQAKDYKNELMMLQKSLKNEGYDIGAYVKDPRFEIYEVKPLNKKTNKIDYTDPLQSKYLWPSSIENSKKFMEKEREWLERAEKLYGIDKEYVVALLKMESDFGKNVGNFRAFNALVSQYLNSTNQNRKKFFYEEIKHYIDFAKKNGMDVMECKSSFAGAIGVMQFMPSNLKMYGVDFDGDGKLNPWDLEDAIGSSANFLANQGFDKNPLKALKAYNPHPTFSIAIDRHAKRLKETKDK